MKTFTDVDKVSEKHFPKLYEQVAFIFSSSCKFNPGLNQTAFETGLTH